MKQKDVFAELKKLGLTVRKSDGEFRVAYPGLNSEASAYYTEDLLDLLNTGRAMAARSVDRRLLKMHCPSTSLH
jgi:hypothetical protein